MSSHSSSHGLLLIQTARFLRQLRGQVSLFGSSAGLLLLFIVKVGYNISKDWCPVELFRNESTYANRMAIGAGAVLTYLRFFQMRTHRFCEGSTEYRRHIIACCLLSFERISAPTSLTCILSLSSSPTYYKSTRKKAI
jgi:hypothetical protein